MVVFPSLALSDVYKVCFRVGRVAKQASLISGHLDMGECEDGELGREQVP